jgi:hypothetical protein
MDASPSPLPPHPGRRLDPAGQHPASSAPRVGSLPAPPPASFRPLGEDADALIRALFACGFTSASVQGRHDIGEEMSAQLTTLIDTLDEAIRGIRHALATYEAA